jgi:hypothetical protein
VRTPPWSAILKLLIVFQVAGGVGRGAAAAPRLRRAHSCAARASLKSPPSSAASALRSYIGLRAVTRNDRPVRLALREQRSLRTSRGHDAPRGTKCQRLSGISLARPVIMFRGRRQIRHEEISTKENLWGKTGAILGILGMTHMTHYDANSHIGLTKTSLQTPYEKMRHSASCWNPPACSGLALAANPVKLRQ